MVSVDWLKPAYILTSTSDGATSTLTQAAPGSGHQPLHTYEDLSTVIMRTTRSGQKIRVLQCYECDYVTRGRGLW